MENMEIWDKLKQPPPSALKPIAAGRLKGKTDIKPQWRYQVMTEIFGMCGVGWKYEIVRLWSESGSEGQIIACAEIKLYIQGVGKWSDPIPGIGGSMLIEKESKGPHTNDEGYKMAVTDALSVAMKMLGVAADIYGGLWDGSKYRNETQKSTGKGKTVRPVKDNGKEDTGEGEGKTWPNKAAFIADINSYEHEDILGASKYADILSLHEVDPGEIHRLNKDQGLALWQDLAKAKKEKDYYRE